MLARRYKCGPRHRVSCKRNNPSTKVIKGMSAPQHIPREKRHATPRWKRKSDGLFRDETPLVPRVA